MMPRLREEREAAMRVLNPSVPESGLVDAAIQLKQAHISERGNSEFAEAALAKLREENDTLRTALETLKAVAAEAYGEWDSDNDPRVGKLLSAMAGYRPKYRADITKALAALSPSQETP